MTANGACGGGRGDSDKHTGRIVKSISGFYEVFLPGGQRVVCRPRGRLRLDKISPLVGDRVVMTRSPADETGRIHEILPRLNAFVRPPVANLDALVIVATLAIPRSDPFLLDRMAVAAEVKNCEVIFCFNKSDLAQAGAFLDAYRLAGYFVLETSARTGEGLCALRERIRGKTVAFAGNSGVGKSSILNGMGLSLPVGEVSERLGRGRHTTRHVEMWPLEDDIWVTDTPGFSAFDLDRIEPVAEDRLSFAFPEFAPFRDCCRFTGCRHVGEDGCAVQQGVIDGHIASIRLESYQRLLKQSREMKPWA